jgi:hypothetical protein
LNLGKILTADGDFLTIEAVQTCAEEACYNLDDLACSLGVGRPLARVTGWAKKVVAMKSVLEEINELLLHSDARELTRSEIF